MRYAERSGSLPKPTKVGVGLPRAGVVLLLEPALTYTTRYTIMYTIYNIMSQRRGAVRAETAQSDVLQARRGSHGLPSHHVLRRSTEVRHLLGAILQLPLQVLDGRLNLLLSQLPVVGDDFHHSECRPLGVAPVNVQVLIFRESFSLTCCNVR